MKIVCNGETRKVAAGTRLGEFITGLGLDPDSVVAEYDGKILNRDEYDDLVLREGAVIELIRFVGGG
jgi:sulfur carrier protein